MNLFSTFPLTIIAILSFFIDNLYAATVVQLIQRDAVTGQDIADTFNQINATIATGLQEAQQSVTQAGPPDFSMATAGLSALSLLAKKADGQLNQLGQDVPLDEGSSQMIYSYLNSSASSVAQLAELVKEGKPFFEKLHDTDKVVEILQTAGYQTTNLFTDLDKHISQQDDEMFDRAEGVFLCSIVNAASTLNSNKVSNEAVNKCSSDAANNYATFEPSDFQGLFPSPPFVGL